MQALAESCERSYGFAQHSMLSLKPWRGTSFVSAAGDVYERLRLGGLSSGRTVRCESLADLLSISVSETGFMVP